MSSFARGLPSIGLSTGEVAPPDSGGGAYLPPYGGPANQDLIDLLLSKVAALQTIVEGKADIGKLRTYIQFSDELIRIQAENIAMVGGVTFLDVWRDQTGQVVGGVHPSLTQIRGGVIKTGQVLSGNYGPSTGSLFDLDNGTLRMGGSVDSKFFFDSSTGDLTISGTLTANSILAKDIQIDGIGGSPTLEDLYDLASSGGISLSDVEDLLQSGVEDVLAGASADFQLYVGAAAVSSRHKDAVPFSSVGAYVGTLRTAMVLSSNGLALGYNRKSDGNWVNAITLDGTTGEATFLGAITATSGTFVGTVSAGSIITSSVTVSGVALSTIASQAAAGQTINTALTTNASLALIGQLNPTNTGAIAVGSISWNSGTGALTGGSGIAITEWGIIGAASGVAKFSIDTSGNAIFSGALSAATGTFAGSLSAATGTFAGSISAATGTFTGDINTTGRVYASGAHSIAGYQASVVGNPANSSHVGVIGRCGSGGIAVVALPNSTGAAMYASGASTAELCDFINSSTGTTLRIRNVGGGTALSLSGKLVKANGSADRIRVYDAGTNAFVAEYRYEFT